MSLPKITDTEKGQYGVTLLPNVPQITASALKEKFEEKSDDLLIPKFNALSDALMASTGASEVGAKLGETDTTIQGAIDSLKTEADGKQDALTFDDTPTDGSENPVTSGGVYDAVATKMTTSVYDINNDGKVNSADTADTLTGLTASVTELNYVDGVTSNIQAQLNGKADSGDIPTALSDLTADSTHRTVTDAEKSTWNGKVDNAYKSIKVGTTTMTASDEDTFELKAGSNVILTPDAGNKSVTISATGGGGGSSSWGNITGTLSDQTDLQTALDEKITKSETAGLVKNDGTIDTNSYAKSSEVAATQTLIKDTVGWKGKNLAYPSASSNTNNGIAYTLNSDNSVSLSNTQATAESRFNYLSGLDNAKNYLTNGSYILSGCPSGASSNTYWMYLNIHNTSDGTFKRNVMADDGINEVPFTVSDSEYVSSIVIKVANGVTPNNVVFYPMIRDASITDSTYEPHHKSVEDWYWENNAKTGVHNLLDWKTPTGTDHDVTFTVNSGKTAITPSGTATGGNAYIYSDMSLKAGTYRLLGGISNNCFIQAYLAQSPWTNYGYDYGNGVTFTLATDATIRIQCNVSSGKTASGVFYPRIIRAEDTSNAVAPYAMTNAELTEKVSVESLTINLTASDKATKLRDDSRRCGNVVNICIQLQVTTEIAKDTEIFRLNGLPHPGYGVAILGETNTGEIIPLMVTSSAYNFFATCKKTIPTGYYAVSYTYIN